MKSILNRVFSSLSASPQDSANKPDGASFPMHYTVLPVETRRNLVAIYAASAAQGSVADASAALNTLKVVLSRPDPDPLVRWNIALAAIETAEKFSELRRMAHNVLRLVVETRTPDDEPELIHLIGKARETAPVPPAFKAL